MKISPIAELPLELAVMEYCGKDDVGTTKPLVQESPRVVVEVKKPQTKVETKDEVVEDGVDSGLLTTEKLVESWKDVIEAVKPYNHSIAGVLRSAHPKGYAGGVITIATQYKFHQERLSEVRVRDILAEVVKKLFGVKVRVEVVLEKP